MSAVFSHLFAWLRINFLPNLAPSMQITTEPHTQHARSCIDTNTVTYLKINLEKKTEKKTMYIFLLPRYGSQRLQPKKKQSVKTISTSDFLHRSGTSLMGRVTTTMTMILWFYLINVIAIVAVGPHILELSIAIIFIGRRLLSNFEPRSTCWYNYHNKNHTSHLIRTNI